MAKTHEEYLAYMSKYNKLYREKNREKLVKYNRDWRKTNRERVHNYFLGIKKKRAGIESVINAPEYTKELIKQRQQFLNKKAS